METKFINIVVHQDKASLEVEQPLSLKEKIINGIILTAIWIAVLTMQFFSCIGMFSIGTSLFPNIDIFYICFTTFIVVFVFFGIVASLLGEMLRYQK